MERKKEKKPKKLLLLLPLEIFVEATTYAV
jgi:hypothetical protein